jgi:diguanylate cyclase (GGDEF)-like protein
LCVEGCPLLAAAERREETELSLSLHHKNGSRIPIRVQAIPLLDEEGSVWGVLELFSDITEIKLERRRLDALHEELFIDSLTQLGNRRFCDKEFSRLVSDFNENREPFASALFDIDDFKLVNDTYGHDFGDRVLSMVASTLSATLREDDIVCRWGGEEFLALLPGVQDGKELHSVLQRVLVMVRESFLTIHRDRVSVTISIGASVAEEGDDEHVLFKRVDKLLYRSKRAGKDRITIG